MTESACAATNEVGAATGLRVGGLQRLSFCDWPGELAATVFCQGCPWACSYCYNQSLRPTHDGAVAWDDVLAFLHSRRGLLDAVVFSGGEPLAQGTLPEAMAAVRALGFRIGMHSGGYSPERFARVLPLVDWVGFDVKAPFDDYESITGGAGSGARARQSLVQLLASGKDYELRTTVQPALLGRRALLDMAATLSAMGARHWVLQRLRAANGTPLGTPCEDVFEAIQASTPWVTIR